MAEKGSLVVSQKDGKIVGMRDAIEQDNASNPRLIQLVDFSEKKLPSPMGLPIRNAITTADSLSLLSLPAEVTNNLITCGDATTLIVFAEFHTSTVGQSVTIIPLIFDDEVSPEVMFALTEQTISVTPGIELYRSPTVLDILGPRKYWDITGASRIGLMVSVANLSTNASIWGYVI